MKFSFKVALRLILLLIILIIGFMYFDYSRKDTPEKTYKHLLKSLQESDLASDLEFCQKKYTADTEKLLQCQGEAHSKHQLKFELCNKIYNSNAKERAKCKKSLK